MQLELAMLTMGLNRIRREWAALRYEEAFRKLMLALKDGFNPQQPRDGQGRWTDGGGITDTRVVSDADPDPIIPWADYADGHHYVPRGVFKKYELSDEARRIFNETTTGKLNDPNSNQFDKMHRDYNDAVQKAFDRYLESKKIDSQKMSGAQAEQFVDEIKRSKEPLIRQLNQRIWMREIMYGLRNFREGNSDMKTTAEIMQNAMWSTLYSDIVRYFSKLGTEDACGHGDFWVVEDYYGWPKHRVFLFNLNLLTLQTIEAIQQMLPNSPEWSVTFVVDVVGKEKAWPPMGITIRKHEIIDGLLRQYLPHHFRFLKIPGSRPGTGYD